MNSGYAKQQLRRKVASLKKDCPAELLAAFSDAIHARIEQSPLFRDAAHIVCYHALPGEVQTVALLEKWYGQKRFFLPAVEGERLKFYPYHGENSLITGAFGIMEPRADGEASAGDIDLAIVPGEAFDRRLNRLGKGRGFYDRFLAEFRKPVMGICFQFQLFDAVPIDGRDCKMTQIITEREIISASF
ncbi:MAG: 5-formyltetrahydrofolate cyclo-ligase [Tannerella sp.]|jgi:5-formyltetrahydrofolate cyclo-ligase|nr:5-formyltetrahydrofolate cyclo-ligase [Tannerella sp.]